MQCTEVGAAGKQLQDWEARAARGNAISCSPWGEHRDRAGQGVGGKEERTLLYWGHVRLRRESCSAAGELGTYKQPLDVDSANTENFARKCLLNRQNLMALISKIFSNLWLHCSPLHSVNLARHVAKVFSLLYIWRQQAVNPKASPLRSLSFSLLTIKMWTMGGKNLNLPSFRENQARTKNHIIKCIFNFIFFMNNISNNNCLIVM